MRERFHGLAVACAFLGALLLVLELLPASPAVEGEAEELARIDRLLNRSARIREILAREPEQAWKRAAWLHDAEAARAQAAAERKPILAVLVVNEYGLKQAARC